MKRYITLIVLLLVGLSWANGQEGAPKGFSYQALLYSGDKPLRSAQVTLEVTLQSESSVLYRERHADVKTSDLGLAEVLVGAGSVVEGSLDGVDWEGGVFIALHIVQGGQLVALGSPVRVPTVPYALHASQASTVSQGSGQDANQPIFQVLNSQGKDIFSVYEHGVRIRVADELTRGVRGGFAVATYSSANKQKLSSLALSEGRMDLTVCEAGERGVRGGFAVATRSGAGHFENRLFISGPSTDLLVDDLLRGVRGGFAVATRGMSGPSMEIADGGVRFTADPAFRGVRGGFAVSHYSLGMGRGDDDASELMMLNDQISYFTLLSSKQGAKGSNFSLRDRKDSARVVTSFASAGNIYAGSGDPNATIVKRPDDPTKLQAKWRLEKMSNGSRWNYPLVKYDGKVLPYTLELVPGSTADLFEVRRLYNPELKAYVDGIALKEGSSVESDTERELLAQVKLVDNPQVSASVQGQVVDMPVAAELLESPTPRTVRVQRDGEAGAVLIWVALEFSEGAHTDNSPLANLPYSAEIVDAAVGAKATVRRDAQGLLFTIAKAAYDELSEKEALERVKVRLESEYLKGRAVVVEMKLTM